MNKERVLMVADAMEQGLVRGLGFNMASWFHKKNSLEQFKDMSGRGCGTTCCGAGWAVHVMAKASAFAVTKNDLIAIGNEAANRDFLSIQELATGWLDLTEEQANSLFFGSPAGKSIEDVTLHQAVNVWRYLTATGKIDWNI